MKLEFLRHNSSRRLLLIFAGWATDAQLFSGIEAEGYDIAVFSDYRSLSHERLSDYDEICLVAWSFGVTAAAAFISANPHLPITLRMAVAGTLTPVDDLTGIPRAVFDGTLQGLTERSLMKFYRRMCGYGQAFEKFKALLPTHRPIEALADELKAVDSRPTKAESEQMFDHVVIASCDAIIPPEAQRRAWAGHPSVIEVDEAHCFSLNPLMARFLVNKPLVGRKFAGSQTTYNSEAKVQQSMAHRLLDLIPADSPASLLEIGCGTGTLTGLLTKHYSSDTTQFTLIDLTPIDASLPGCHIVNDAETAINSIADHSIDLIVSAATVQWFNSPARFVRTAYRKLRPGGTLAVSLFSPDNFRELHPFNGPNAYLSPAQWQHWLSEAFDIPDVRVIADEPVTVRFDSPTALLRHLRLTGVNATNRTHVAAVNSARSIIARGLRQLTYCPLYIVISKPQND